MSLDTFEKAKKKQERKKQRSQRKMAHLDDATSSRDLEAEEESGMPRRHMTTLTPDDAEEDYGFQLVTKAPEAYFSAKETSSSKKKKKKKRQDSERNLDHNNNSFSKKSSSSGRRLNHTDPALGSPFQDSRKLHGADADALGLGLGLGSGSGDSGFDNVELHDRFRPDRPSDSNSGFLSRTFQKASLAAILCASATTKAARDSKRTFAATVLLAMCIIVFLGVSRTGRDGGGGDIVTKVPSKSDGTLGKDGGTGLDHIWEEHREHHDGATGELLERHGLIKTLILRSGVTPIKEEEMIHSYGAAHLALDWIVHEDTQLSVLSENSLALVTTQLDSWTPEVVTLLERYTLATLYYSTMSNETSTSWENRTNWLDATQPVCGWYGVICQEETLVVPMRGTEPGTEDTTNTATQNVVSQLKLFKNGLKGKIPNELGLAIPFLREVDFSTNALQGTIPKTLVMSPRLERLFLGHNLLTGTLPLVFGLATQMQEIFLQHNQLSGTLNAEIFSDMFDLNGLSLYKNKFTGSLSEKLGDLHRLRFLYLDDNEFDSTIPTSLGTMKELVDLRLRNNKLTGEIPSELSEATSLEILYLDTNELKGSIPASIFTMTSLRTYCSPNRGRPDLQYVFLNDNEFTGDIPDGLGNMRDLRELRLANNNLVGPIPADFGVLLDLEILLLNGNGLTGTIPKELGDLTKLTSLRLQGNELNGEMPTIMCLLRSTKLKLLESDCDGDSPEVVCTCCSDCF
eukprot:scaffold1602_cov56-Attheya_sp.AAC.1